MSGTPGIRWRVVDGASPNVARYVPAKRPSCVKPKRSATSATLTLSGWASHSARRTSFNRRSSTYWVGVMPINSALHDRSVRSLTTIRSHNSGICRSAEIFRQDLFEPDHDPGMVALGARSPTAPGACRTTSASRRSPAGTIPRRTTPRSARCSPRSSSSRHGRRRTSRP